MVLAPGSRVGPYEVVAPLGAGGMGEVYRARDTRLHRDVALKVLPESFALDPERLARFKREAQVLAALNHPHIGAIHGLEEAGGVQALVLELVEGPTLADRIADGAIPLPEALPIARQIADALEAAHELGIIHRDLKPSNIKITPDGAVKVLDFGLAKPGAADGAHHATDVTISPTITSPAMMTGVGTILGTAAYMAPEQAKGRAADKRSDVWAFGCVLYEMLTGKRAFDGEDISDTMAAVLRAEPDWNALPRETPRALQRLVRSCLHKDRKQRVPDIAVARFEIDGALSAPDADLMEPRAKRTPRWRTLAATGALVIAAWGLTVAAVWSYLRPGPARVTRFDIAPVGAAPFTVGPVGVNLMVSPDGSHIVYHVRRGAGALELRRFDQLDSQTITGTEGATHPAFSPDGRTLVFVKDRKLQKLALDATTSVQLCDVFNVAGTSWLTDTDIVFAQTGAQGGLYRVSAAGGQPERIAAPDASKGERDYAWPDALPGGQAVLFTLVYVPGSAVAYRSRFIWRDRDGKTLGVAASDELDFPRYPRISPDGRRLAATLGPSNEGSIWIYDLRGDAQPLKLTFKAHNIFPTWTPDGRRVVFGSNPTGVRNLFWMPADASLLEPERLLTSDNLQQPMTWSPDGQWLLYLGTAAQSGNDLWLMPGRGERKPRPVASDDVLRGRGRLLARTGAG